MQCVEEESSGNIYSQVHCNIKENDWSFLDSTWSQTKQDAYEILPIGGRGIVRRIEGRIENRARSREDPHRLSRPLAP